jgi:predicted transposase YdaD
VLKFGEVYEQGFAAVPEELREEEGIEMALSAMKRAYATDEIREMIEFRRKADLDESTRMNRARREGREEGLAEGVEKGKVEGRQKGLTEGVEKGKAEGLRAAARKLLDSGMDREAVLKMLGLPPDFEA